MIDHAFSQYDLLILFIGSENFRSQRAAQKIGAQRDPDHMGKWTNFSGENWTYIIQKKDWI